MFAPTHEIVHNGQTIPVRLVDGVAYTQDEWDTSSTADWSFTPEDGLLFQGQVPMGTSEIRSLP